MTTQTRSPRGAQSCIVDARILAHLVDELQPWGSTMRRYAILFALVSLLLSVTAFSHGQTPEAAVNHFKDGARKISKGDLDGAIEEYTRAIRLSSHFNSEKSGASRLGNSLTEYSSEDVTVVDPFTANAYNNRGLARFKKNDYPGAIEDYDQALKIRPGQPSIYLNRAAALRANGDLQAARRDLDRAIAFKDDFYEAYTNRGSVRLDLGDTEGAMADLNRSIEINNRVPESFYQRGYAYLTMKNFDAALADFERAIKLSPEMGWAYQGRGTAYMYKGEMLNAVDDFTRAITYDPKIAWAYFNRGLARIFLGQETEARKDFDECLKLQPDLKAQLDTRIELAKQLRRLGKLQE